MYCCVAAIHGDGHERLHVFESSLQQHISHVPILLSGLKVQSAKEKKVCHFFPSKICEHSQKLIVFMLYLTRVSTMGQCNKRSTPQQIHEIDPT